MTSWLADPPASSAIAAAGGWVQGVLAGPFAVSIAVIAIASVGLLMLAGRVDLRRGLSVVMGCFVLFGAPVIATALVGVEGSAAEPYVAQPPVEIRIPEQSARPAGGADAFDPYAGASIR